VNLADLVGFVSVVENALGDGRLTGVNVGHDADVADEGYPDIGFERFFVHGLREGCTKAHGRPTGVNLGAILNKNRSVFRSGVAPVATSGVSE